MIAWSSFTQSTLFKFDETSVKRHWERLHLGDAEPIPADKRLLSAWALFHSGHFQQAAEAGLAIGGAGITLANKATCVYACYLEPNDARRLQLYRDVVDRAHVQTSTEPNNPNAYYWLAYALGRYSQGISVAKALAQGVGTRTKQALEKTIALQALHADAHSTLGMFHAEVIDKVGMLIAAMTYGARKDLSLKCFQEASRLAPLSVYGLIEYATGISMLEGETRQNEATLLYEKAAAQTPLDATEWLDVALAQEALNDGN